MSILCARAHLTNSSLLSKAFRPLQLYVAMRRVTLYLSEKMVYASLSWFQGVNLDCLMRAFASCLFLCLYLWGCLGSSSKIAWLWAGDFKARGKKLRG